MKTKCLAFVWLTLVGGFSLLPGVVPWWVWVALTRHSLPSVWVGNLVLVACTYDFACVLANLSFVASVCGLCWPKRLPSPAFTSDVFVIVCHLMALSIDVKRKCPSLALAKTAEWVQMTGDS